MKIEEVQALIAELSVQAGTALYAHYRRTAAGPLTCQRIIFADLVSNEAFGTHSLVAVAAGPQDENVTIDLSLLEALQLAPTRCSQQPEVGQRVEVLNRPLELQKMRGSLFGRVERHRGTSTHVILDPEHKHYEDVVVFWEHDLAPAPVAVAEATPAE